VSPKRGSGKGNSKALRVIAGNIARWRRKGEE
jgi:hypothetical protein